MFLSTCKILTRVQRNSGHRKKIKGNDAFQYLPTTTPTPYSQVSSGTICSSQFLPLSCPVPSTPPASTSIFTSTLSQCFLTSIFHCLHHTPSLVSGLESGILTRIFSWEMKYLSCLRRKIFLRVSVLIRLLAKTGKCEEEQEVPQSHPEGFNSGLCSHCPQTETQPAVGL